MPRFTQALLDIQLTKKVGKAALESGKALPKKAEPKVREPGDPHKLRGVPVVGVRGGVGGEITGTRPGRSKRLDEWKGRSRGIK